MTGRARFVDRFRTHIGFLKRSSDDYDKGHEDESLRMATTLRVLFHNRGSSTSLLTHLGLQDTSMLSTTRGTGNWYDYLSHHIALNDPVPVRMLPMLGDRFTELAFADWWDGESIFVHEGLKYTRKRIILSVAEKDGGAHVDRKLEHYYEVLCAGEYALGLTPTELVFEGGPAPYPLGATIYSKNAHLALIRQFVHETLMVHNYKGWEHLA